jgi:hypothetical protein
MTTFAVRHKIFHREAGDPALCPALRAAGPESALRPSGRHTRKTSVIGVAS